MQVSFLRDSVVGTLSTIRDYVRLVVSECARGDVFLGHGTDDLWDEALQLVLTALHLPMDIDPAVLDARLTTAEQNHLVSLLKRRVEERIPVPYLVQEAWFAGMRFYVDERVIIPRSPIAELIEAGFSPWIDTQQVNRILDLCTGSACIAVACACAFEHATIDAVDISKEALEVAATNVKRYDLGSQITLIQSDLFEKLAAQKYDLIISNPPYVSTAEYNSLPPEYHHEPALALLAEEEGLAIVKRILRHAAEFLTPKGVLVVELGKSQPYLEERFPQVPFTWLQFEQGGEGVLLLTAEELKEFQHVLTLGK